MTQEEKKAAWDKLTQEEKEEIKERRKEIIQWSIEEEEKAIKKIKAEGRWIGGLDGVYPELQEISKEYKKRLQGLLEEITSEKQRK